MFAIKGNSSPPKTDSTQPSATQTPAPPAATPTQAGNTQFKKPLESAPSLDRLVEMSKDSTKATTVLDALAKLDPKTNEEKTKAGFARYNAYLIGRGDKEKACDAIRDVEGASKQTSLENRVANLIIGCAS
jgi:hypothetical protein